MIETIALWIVIVAAVTALLYFVATVSRQWHELLRQKRGEPMPDWASPFDATTIQP